jgi:hypothetical protein
VYDGVEPVTVVFRKVSITAEAEVLEEIFVGKPGEAY